MSTQKTINKYTVIIKNHEEKMNICCTAKMMERDEIVEAFGDGAMDTLQLGNEYYNYLYNKQ